MPIIGVEPEEEIEKQTKRRNTLLTWVLILVIVIVAGIWFWLYYLEANSRDQLLSLDAKITSSEAQIEEKEVMKEEALVLQKQIDNLDALIKNHIYWSKTFSEIEDNTLKKAYFSRFTGDAQGKKIVLSAQVPDFTSAAKQLVVFREAEKFTDIDISSISITVEEGKAYIGFDVTLSLADDLLMPHLER